MKYLFDFSIASGCPALAADYTVPKYVAHDLLQVITCTGVTITILGRRVLYYFR